MKSPGPISVRVLAITGAAFLVGTVHALLVEPVKLGPASTNSGTEGAKGDPNRASSNAAEQTAPSDEAAVSETDTLLDAPVPEGMLTLREAHELWELGAYFIDSRHLREFEAGHIQYASWLMSSMFDGDLDRVFAVTDVIPTDGTVVLYCVGGDCDASKNTAARLEGYGYTDLRIMGAGYADWAAAGLPTETGYTP